MNTPLFRHNLRTPLRGNLPQTQDHKTKANWQQYKRNRKTITEKKTVKTTCEYFTTNNTTFSFSSLANTECRHTHISQWQLILHYGIEIKIV